MYTCVPAKSVGYYLSGTSLDQQDYYGAKQGVWWTPHNMSAVARSRFVGCEDGEAIDNGLFVKLANGQLPDGTTVGRNGSGIRMPGYDCHFAPAKSVSLVFAFADETTRRLIVGIHNEAVRRSLQFIYDWGLIGARRNAAGKDHEAVAGLVAAVFTEFTSRDNDPQIHSHAYVPNIGVRRDGSVGALDNHRSTVFQLLVGAIYQAEMAFGLIKIGFRLERHGRAFEIAGVPRPLIKTFSKRRNTIERVAKALGIDPSRNRAAANVIALDTRPAKSGELSLEQLQPRWLAQLTHAGYDQSDIAPTAIDAEQHVDPPENLVEMAVTEAFETSAVLTKARLMANVAEAFIGQYDVDTVEKQILHTLPSHLIELVNNAVTGNCHYTTHTILSAERELLRIARKGRRFRKIVPDLLIDEAIAARPTLSEEQKDAVWHALNADQIAITEGSAGSGKSFKLDAVADACRAAGLDVWALGPSWSATQVLALDTDTKDDRARALSGFLNEVESGRIQLTANSVLLLDESGMVGTMDLHRLAAAVAEVGCKLVLSGDTMQLSSVAAGAPMRLLARFLGTSRMSQIRRQKLAWSRAASMEFAKGRADRGLKIYQQRGNVDWIRGRSETLSALADRYVADMLADREQGSGGPLPSCLAIASRNEDVNDLNGQIRARLQDAGFVDPLDIEVGVALRAGGRNKRKQTGSLKISVGDRIVFGETLLLPERTIRNADVARVLDIQAGPPPRLTLEFEADGSCITRDLADLVGFRDQHEVKLPMVRHAYAATVHFAQGRTVDRAYIASTQAMSREAIYVAMTRHRHVAQLFVDTTRFKAISVTGLPNALLSLLGKRDRKAADATSQLEAKRQAFFDECLRPDSKVNASDFVADLDAVLDAAATARTQPSTRFEAVKAETLNRMSARSAAGSGEAARFDKNPQPSGAPNWFHRAILASVERMNARGTPVPESNSEEYGGQRFHLPRWRTFSAMFWSHFRSASELSSSKKEKRRANRVKPNPLVTQVELSANAATSTPLLRPLVLPSAETPTSSTCQTTPNPDGPC
jgi:conjugative relaxase-like TrwC/TraI family protein